MRNGSIRTRTLKDGTEIHSCILYLGKKPHATDPSKMVHAYREVTQPAGTSLKKAEKELARLVTAKDDGILIKKSKATLAEYFGTWLTNRLALGDLAGSTQRQYRMAVRKVQRDPIGLMLVQDVDVVSLESYRTRLLADMGLPTVRIYMWLLGTALDKARKSKLVLSNVMNDVDKPKAAKNDTVSAQVNCWTEEEARAVIAAADGMGTLISALYALALDSGARIRELAGLTWANVHLDQGYIDITQQLNPIWTSVNGQPLFTNTKTGKSRRVTLDPETIARLRRHKTAQTFQRKAAGDLGLVFTNTQGGVRPLVVQSVNSREHTAVIKAAGVTVTTFHCTRHTMATLALLAGKPLPRVSERLGHASSEETLRTYTHVLAAVAEQPMKMGALLYG